PMVEERVRDVVFFTEGGPDDGTTTRTYRGADPGRLAASGGRDDRGGGLPADRDHRADLLHVETELRRAGAARTAGAPAIARRKHETEAAGRGSLARSPYVAGDRPKKALRPRDRRALARWAQLTYQVSERRVSRLVPIARASLQYQSRRDPQEVLRMRLR